jgi:Flp pilus assembly protein TadB
MDRSDMSAQERAARRSGALTGVLWHLATFLIINAFLWFIDSLQLGIEWAYWVSLTWGIALAFHVAWYFIGERGLSKYERSLDQERRL